MLDESLPRSAKGTGPNLRRLNFAQQKSLTRTAGEIGRPRKWKPFVSRLPCGRRVFRHLLRRYLELPRVGCYRYPSMHANSQALIDTSLLVDFSTAERSTKPHRQVSAVHEAFPRDASVVGCRYRDVVGPLVADSPQSWRLCIGPCPRTSHAFYGQRVKCHPKQLPQTDIRANVVGHLILLVLRPSFLRVCC